MGLKNINQDQKSLEKAKEELKPKEDEKESLLIHFIKGFWKVLNSAIIVACFSGLVFGLVIAKYGAKFQYKYWLKQEGFKRYQNHLEKLDDRRADLIIRMYTIFGIIEQELWNIFSATHGYREAKKNGNPKEERIRIERLKVHRDALQKVKSDLDNIGIENKLFFPEQAGSVLNKKLLKYWDKAHAINLYETDWEKEGSTMEEFNYKMNELNQIKNSIRQFLVKMIVPAKH